MSNYLLAPLIERIAIQDALAGRQPNPVDVSIAAEWNYRLWRASGKPTEVKLPKSVRGQPLWPNPQWVVSELLWYAVAMGLAGALFLLFCMTWRSR